LLHDWCAGHKIHFRDNQELIKIPEVIEKIQKEVNAINKTLGTHEQIQAYGWCMKSGRLLQENSRLP
jgi:long-chain acyl-CoA synthetase